MMNGDTQKTYPLAHNAMMRRASPGGHSWEVDLPIESPASQARIVRIYVTAPDVERATVLANEYLSRIYREGPGLGGTNG